MPGLELILLVGQYAQKYYLPGKFQNVTAAVKQWREYGPKFFPLVHPSPRNRRWLRNNPWFEEEVVPVLRQRVGQILPG